MILLIILLKLFFINPQKISSCFDHGSCEITNEYSLMLCTNLDISLFFNITPKCQEDIFLISKIHFKANGQILTKKSLFSTVKFFHDTNHYQASIDYSFIVGLRENLFQMESIDGYNIIISLNNIRFNVFGSQSCNKSLTAKKPTKIYQLIIGKGTVYLKKICPLLFSNIYIQYLSIKYLSNTFYKKNFIQFALIREEIDLNAVVKTLDIFLAENINLTLEILNPNLFKYTEEIYLFGKIKIEQKNLFYHFPNLRFIQIDIFFARALIHNGIEWLNWFNIDLNVNMSNKTCLQVNKNRTIHINIAYSSNQQSYKHLTVNDVFPEEDFCVYTNFPFSRMVLLTVNDRIEKEASYQYTCTFKWIAKHYLDFKLTQIPSYYDFSWELDYGRFKNFSTEMCDFGSRLKNCQKEKFNIKKIRLTIYDFKIFIAYLDDLISAIFTPFLSLVVLVISIATLIVFKKFEEKKSIKKFQLYLIKSHAILSAVYSLIDLFGLINKCSNINGLFCSRIYTTVLAQYYQIFFVDFGQSITKFCINITIFSFIICRLIIIENKKFSSLTRIFEIPFKKLALITITFGFFISISGLFIHKINRYNINDDYPALFLINNFTLHQYVEDLLKSMVLIKIFINSIFFIFINLVIDIIMIFRVKKSLKKSNLLRAKMKMKSKTNVNNRMVYCTILIISLNVILKLPELFSPVYYFLQYYGLVNLIFLHNKFQFFLQVICDRFNFNYLMSDLAKNYFIISNVCNFFYYFGSDKQFKKFFTQKLKLSVNVLLVYLKKKLMSTLK